MGAALETCFGGRPWTDGEARFVWFNCCEIGRGPRHLTAEKAAQALGRSAMSVRHLIMDSRMRDAKSFEEIEKTWIR